MGKKQNHGKGSTSSPGMAEDIDRAVGREFDLYLDSIASVYANSLAKVVQQREREFEHRTQECMASISGLKKAMEEHASSHARFLAKATEERDKRFHNRAEAALDSARNLQNTFERQARELNQQVATHLSGQQQAYRESLEAILEDTERRIDHVTRTALKRRLTWVLAAIWLLAIGQLVTFALLLNWSMYFTAGK